MAAKPKKRVTSETVLREINRIFEQDDYYQSRQSGKRFYKAHKLPPMLSIYIVNSGKKLRDHAKEFGMSPKTLESILAGGATSDNMLIRIRSSLSRDVATERKKATYLGDWRDASPSGVAEAITIVSQKLVFLKKVIEGNNFLKSEDSPIDKIQVAQLLALLAATIEALRAPHVDKESVGGFFRWLARIMKKSAEKGVEKIVVDAMEDAVKSGKDLVGNLSESSGTTDIGTFI
jgi:hypothetical protein